MVASFNSRDKSHAERSQEAARKQRRAYKDTNNEDRPKNDAQRRKHALTANVRYQIHNAT
jgi:hypothetical protein